MTSRALFSSSLSSRLFLIIILVFSWNPRPNAVTDSVKTQITEMGSEKLNNFAFLRILKQIQKKSFQTVLTSKTCFVYFRNNRLIIPVENWWSAPLRKSFLIFQTLKPKKLHTVCNTGNAKTMLNKVFFWESGWNL